VMACFGKADFVAYMLMMSSASEFDRREQLHRGAFIALFCGGIHHVCVIRR